jgi:hypothetical protein
MGGFCVFGVSRQLCKATAERQIVAYGKTVAEWARERDALAARLFEETIKAVRISPEFDAPQFCEDWMAVTPSEIKLAKVMAYVPKTDGGGQARKAKWYAGHDLGRVCQSGRRIAAALTINETGSHHGHQ